jgi:hypothetical protein
MRVRIRRFRDLSQCGRGFASLFADGGFAAPRYNLNTGIRNYPTVQITVAGRRYYGVSYLLDGGTLNDPYNNLNLPLPFPDALRVFKVETSVPPAQFGRHGSAAVNAFTKS